MQNKRSVLILVASVLLICAGSVLIAAGASRLVYGFAYSLRAMMLDAVILCIPALLMVWATGSAKRVGLLLLPISGLVIAGQAIIQAALGAPLRLSYIDAIPTLMSVISFWEKVALCIVLATVLLGILWLLRSPWPRWLVLVLGLAIVATGFMPGGWGHRVALRFVPGDSPDPIHVGSFVFLLSENAGRQVVDRETVSRIVGNSTWALSYKGVRRNIHLVLLETFWDPLKLKHDAFSQDPFDPRFRKMMEESAGSSALTPHFGHLTANAEFESLCGLPATKDGAIFVSKLRNRMPCLPRILEAMGYSTQASHANHSTSWSRNRAYDLLGFSRFNAGGSFEVDDTDELFLTDASFFRQNISNLDEGRSTTPTFNYLVSLSSHWPYKRDMSRRPDVIAVSPENTQLKDYVNGLHYSSAAFADWVEEVRTRDPDALIVAYGDHAPSMPPRQYVYFESGFVMGDPAKLTDDQLLELAGTPLLVIDGRKGVVPVGVLPVSDIADLILKTAFAGAVQLPQTQALRASIGRDVHVRSYIGRLLVENAGAWKSCDMEETKHAGATGSGGASGCAAGRRMLLEGKLLRDDMAEGNAYFVEAMHIPEAVSKDDNPMLMTSAGCAIDVASFGPKEIVLGNGFNIQKASGKSAFWFNLNRRIGTPRIRVDKDVAQLEMYGLFAAATFDNPDFVHQAGKHDVFVVCEGGKDVSLGSVQVAAPGRGGQEESKLSGADMHQPLPLANIGEVSSRLRIEAWMSPEICTPGKDWLGAVLVKWAVPGASSVRLSVRGTGEEPYNLWSSGTAKGQAMTGEWARDGMQILVEADGQRMGEVALDSAECHK